MTMEDKINNIDERDCACCDGSGTWYSPVEDKDIVCDFCCPQ